MLLANVIMPRLGGQSLAAEIARRHADIKALARKAREVLDA